MKWFIFGLAILFQTSVFADRKVAKRWARNSALECDILTVSEIKKKKKAKVNLDEIYNGSYYLNMNSGHSGLFWERSAENIKGQLLELFITRGRVRVGDKNRKLRPAWLIGYKQPGTGHFVLRFFAFGSLNCRAAHRLIHWNQIKHLTAYSNLRKIQIRKNNFRHAIFQLSNLDSSLL
ncbi:Oidioi.mRNA.OKI2018_I69.chr2.g5961.t1.cds [Oikopleura dioica]|uniref:Oidioi.mRNA.OKI2018_I69.chr2.g5961.t1.cds n=1 Tax=Oikopleura dioica TaxID=34765 RepID=A0ABN7T2H3_OIKDI|nr:Oidioi.mRNA.OKI2018_I69.chr2.g5961.t1.cds [Oikopleura dioica]